MAKKLNKFGIIFGNNIKSHNELFYILYFTHISHMSFLSTSESELSPIISPALPESTKKKDTGTSYTTDSDRMSDISNSTLIDETQNENKSGKSTCIDDDAISIDSWAEDIINNDLPVIYHLIGELKKTQARLKKITSRYRKKKRVRLVIQE